MKRKIDRFDKYMKTCDLNDNKVTVALNLSVGTLGKSRKEGRDLSDKVVEEILNFYTDLNRVWLLTGEGEMIKSGAATTEPDRILEMKDGILGVAEAIVEIIAPQNREFAKIADACQKAVAMADKLATSNAKLVDQLFEKLDRIEGKVDLKGAAGGAKGAVKTGA